MNERAEPGFSFNRLRIGAVIAVAIAIAFIAWLILKGDDKNNSSTPTRAPGVAASVSDLKKLPGTLGHRVYWAGKRSGFTYELTQTSGGDIYVRYLSPGVQVGDNRPNFLTVGTYPHPKAFGTVTKASKRKGEYVRTLSGGGLAVSSQVRPTSVYVGYPGTNYLIEVFDPSPARARSLVESGKVRPIR
jgi:hypothetical protein